MMKSDTDEFEDDEDEDEDEEFDELMGFKGKQVWVD